MGLSIGILSGGQSKRFWPLEEKNLFEFFGIPLLVYQLRRYNHFFRQLGVTPEFVVVTNELNQQLIKSTITSSKVKQVKVVAQKLPDQFGAVQAVLETVNLKQPLLIVNSNDIISEKLIRDMYKKTPKSDIVLSATSVKRYFPGGYLLTQKGTDQVERIWEKPPADKVPSELHLFRFVLDYFKHPKVLLEAMEANPSVSEYESAINLILPHATSTYVLSTEPFTSLKYPWHVLDAVDIFLGNIRERVVKTDDIDPTAQLSGNIYIESGVKIGSYAKIVGPTYIGQNTIVGDHTLIRQSHIGQNCLVGAHSEVARSYLGSQVLLHRNYVGDSVLGNGVNLGANAITANWRFDQQTIKLKINDNLIDTNRSKLGALVGEKAQIGINVSLMPGVRIVREALIFPGSVQYKDALAQHEKRQ